MFKVILERQLSRYSDDSLLFDSLEFLYNLFADPDIIRLPGPLKVLQKAIAHFIATRRAPKSCAAYDSIGGGSPIFVIVIVQKKNQEASTDGPQGQTQYFQ
jgi:protoheme ferro-lyase